MPRLATNRSLFRLAILCSLATLGAFACAKNEGPPVVEPPPPPPAPPPPPPTVPTIALSPATVAVNDTVGTSSPDSVTVAITNSGTGSLGGLSLGTVTYDAAARNWLWVTMTGTSAPASLILKANNTGLAAGTYTATVPVTASGATNSPANVTFTFTVAPVPAPPPPPPITGITIVALGNLGSCSSGSARAIADMVAQANPDYIFLMGGNVDTRGNIVSTQQDYLDCFEPVWGRFRAKMFVALGENEVDRDTLSPTASYANGADAYFGAALVGPPGKNYRSFNLGNWHIVSLNVSAGGPWRPKPIRFNAGSEQLNWLWRDLRDNASKKCTLAFWHDGLWQSSNDPATATDPAPNHYYRNQPIRGVWTVLYEWNADLVLNGGQHIYERFAPMRYAEGYTNPTPSEFALDSARGIRQITAGLGGDGPHSTPTFLGTHPLSEYRSGGNGAVKVVLGTDEYSWEFLNTSGSSVQDRGRGTCH